MDYLVGIGIYSGMAILQNCQLHSLKGNGLLPPPPERPILLRTRGNRIVNPGNVKLQTFKEWKRERILKKQIKRHKQRQKQKQKERENNDKLRKTSIIGSRKTNKTFGRPILSTIKSYL